MVIWEKDWEIDYLRKQLEAKNVAVGLPLQPLMEQSTGAYGTNVVAPTIGSQRTVSFQPIKTSTRLVSPRSPFYKACLSPLPVLQGLSVLYPFCVATIGMVVRDADLDTHLNG